MIVLVEGIIFESHDGNDCLGSMTGTDVESVASKKGAVKIAVFILA
jgi:hypothetical protein